MRRLRWLAFLGLGALLILLASPGQAQDPRSGPLERKALDTTIYTTLRDVINHGADLYNSGDWAGCYRLYEGSLMALRPVLDHRPELQRAISEGLSKAEADPALSRRAFVLRTVIDKIRSDVNPNPKPVAKSQEKVAEKKPQEKSPEEKKPATLWERLGGEKGVAKVVNDLVKVVATDPKVDFTRGGKFTPTPADTELLKKHLVQQISSLTGGPYKYEGLDMKETHKGMGITSAQYDAFVADVEKVLKDNNVLPEDAAKIVAAVNSYRKDIIEPAKPVEKKPEEKKPEEKRPPAGKPEDKKPEPTASLSGKVTSVGKPLGSGTIGLHGRGGKTYSAAIKADGSYEIRGVKPGEYIVTIQDPAVAKKFTDPKTSSLQVDVLGGAQTADLAVEN